jgi:pimeloyl-ACP methyl ester carboxylesterase
MIRRSFSLLLLLALLLPTLSTVQAAPAAETNADCTNWLTQPSGQNFWVGEPATANAGGPVVVFVHGYLMDHYFWNVLNDAVRDACNQGFRVAAVDLGRFSSIWDNGSNLKTKLQAIANYYGVAKVNIIAHSKGGIDTQTAIVHYGAGPLVQSYIAMGTPFGGTDLADEACSWYGSALWQCNDATWNLRIGYMSYVRSITDGRSENGLVRAYAARGTECEWFVPTCYLIDGDSDAIVPAWSVWANGRDSHISDRSDLRHDEVGQTQFYNTPWLFSYLGRATSLAADTGVNGEGEKQAPVFARSNYTMRGGVLAGKVTDSIAVEGGLTAVHFILLSTADTEVAVVSPSGVRYEAKAEASKPTDLLQGIFYSVRVEQPEAGTWQVVAARNEQASEKGAQAGYMLRVNYEGGVTIQLDSDLRAVQQPGSSLPISIVASQAVKEATLNANLRGKNHAVLSKAEGAIAGQALTLPREAGTYNVDLHITGIAADGSAFERTLVTSVAAVDADAGMKVESVR